MPNIFGFKSNKAKIKTYDANEITELRSTLMSRDLTYYNLAKEYTDDQIDALPAGGLYQPLANMGAYFGQVFNSSGYRDIGEYIHEDADMFIIDMSLSGSIGINANSLIQPFFGFGFNSIAPGSYFRVLETLTAGNSILLNSCRFRLIYKKISAWGVSAVASDNTLTDDSFFASFGPRTSGSDSLFFDTVGENFGKNLYVFLDNNKVTNTEDVTVTSLSGNLFVRNYKLEV